MLASVCLLGVPRRALTPTPAREEPFRVRVVLEAVTGLESQAAVARQVLVSPGRLESRSKVEDGQGPSQGTWQQPVPGVEIRWSASPSDSGPTPAGWRTTTRSTVPRPRRGWPVIGTDVTRPPRGRRFVRAPAPSKSTGPTSAIAAARRGEALAARPRRRRPVSRVDADPRRRDQGVAGAGTGAAGGGETATAVRSAPVSVRSG
jgi:hypothetical protein